MRGTGKSILIVVLVCMTVMAACAPVIETEIYPASLASMIERQAGPRTIVLDTSHLEKTPDTLDPERLKETLVEIAKSANSGQEIRVEPASSCLKRPACAEVSLSRLDYTKQTIKLPPAAPCGLPILYPLVFPALLKRNYIRLEITVQADLLFYNGEGQPAKQLFLSESATARGNFFNSGEQDASERLEEIAFQNFSVQLLTEF